MKDFRVNQDQRELGRLANVRSGKLERALPMGTWLAPRSVELNERDGPLRLEYVIGEGNLVRSEPGLLNEFIRLADEGVPLQRFQRFARRWGVIGFCHHMLPSPITSRPSGHDDGLVRPWLASANHGLIDATTGQPHPLLVPARASEQGEAPQKHCVPIGWTRPYDPVATGIDPIGGWRLFAREACAIVDSAAQLKQELPAPAEALTILRQRHGLAFGALEMAVSGLLPGMASAPKAGAVFADTNYLLRVQRLQVAEAIGSWMRLGGVRFELEWESPTPRVQLVPAGLFGALAIQLAAIIGAADFAVCTSCGAPFHPSRRPSPNDRTYCPDCRKAGRPQADASRDYYRRRRKESLADRGEGVS